jgi:Rrf2 family protein
MRTAGGGAVQEFQRLARRGLLESRRGPGGGYRLATPPEMVTLAEVASALGAGDERHGRCLLAERDCRRDAPCLLHAAVIEADGRLVRALQELTLADLAAEALRSETR